MQVFKPPTERYTSTLGDEEPLAGQVDKWQCVLVAKGGNYRHLDFDGLILPAKFIEDTLNELPEAIEVRFGNWYTYSGTHKVIVTDKTISIVDVKTFARTQYELANSTHKHMHGCSWEFTDDVTFIGSILSIIPTVVEVDPDAELIRKAKIAEYRLLRELDRTVDEIERDTTTGPLPSSVEEDTLLSIANMTPEQLEQEGLYHED